MSDELIPASIAANLASATIQLADDDILLRLTNTEDSTLERKTTSDYRDCLKTAVAFSNSLPIGDPGVVFLGVFDNGRVQDNPELDSFQMKVSAEISKIYPPIYPQLRVIKNKDAKQFLAVIVRGSPDRLHFAGQAHTRVGSKTVVASEQQFVRLIVERNSKAREILKWAGKEIIFPIPRGENTVAGNQVFRGSGRASCRLLDCNQFFVTLEFTSEARTTQRAYPLSSIEISYDCDNKCLELVGSQL